MRASRTMLYGGLIGGVAVSSHLAFDGLVGAAGLFVALFTLVAASGILLAVLTEEVSAHPVAWFGSSIRGIRYRGSIRETCSGCARLIIDLGTVRVCASCDLIAVPFAS